MVTYAVPSHRVTIFGTSMSATEEWATGFWLGSDTFTGDPTQAEADAIKGLWQTFFTTASSKFWSGCKTNGIKIAKVGTDGTANPALTVFANYATPISGASTDTGIMPPQISLVATLTSDKARGFGSKGRMYLPGNNATIDSSGKVNSTVLSTLVTNFKTFLDGVNAHADVPANLMLNSAAAAGIPGHAADNFIVTGCRIGNVYDTQRRRRNQLQESYTAATLA